MLALGQPLPAAAVPVSGGHSQVAEPAAPLHTCGFGQVVGEPARGQPFESAVQVT